MSAMSCTSRQVNAIGMAPGPIRRWGISRSHSSAVKQRTDRFPSLGLTVDGRVSLTGGAPRWSTPRTLCRVGERGANLPVDVVDAMFLRYCREIRDPADVTGLFEFGQLV